jgi:hypothetical protein
MKTLKFTLVIVLLKVLAVNAMQAQTSENTPSSRKKYYNTLSYYPLSALGSGIELGFEAFDDNNLKNSIFILGGAYIGQGNVLTNTELRVKEFYGARALLNYRFYIDLDDIEQKDRLFIGPYFMFKHIIVKGEPDPFWTGNTPLGDFSVSAFGPGILFGGSTAIASQLLITAYFGSGFLFNTNEEDAKRAHLTLVNPYNRGIGLQFGLGLGYKF